MKQDLVTPTIKEEKRIEKRTDQTYTDILELFAEHQEQSEAEEEQINTSFLPSVTLTLNTESSS